MMYNKGTVIAYRSQYNIYTRPLVRMPYHNFTDSSFVLSNLLSPFVRSHLYQNRMFSFQNIGRIIRPSNCLNVLRKHKVPERNASKESTMVIAIALTYDNHMHDTGIALITVSNFLFILLTYVDVKAMTKQLSIRSRECVLE